MSVDTSMTPYVHVAAFCQTALNEANGVLSLIRLIDRYPIVGQTKEMQPTTINITLAVVLKSGNMTGSATLSIKPMKPDGNPMPPLNVPVLFEGMERGVGIITQMQLALTEPGLYWFDVFIDEVVLLTRIPLRILYQEGQQIILSQPPTT
ncbi:MAG TPA: hypothetical protein VMB85_06435 [Bryobacteraceae bacterium]|nr:hypothetical protein [Bryobacteraceae bacterium]